MPELQAARVHHNYIAIRHKSQLDVHIVFRHFGLGMGSFQCFTERGTFIPSAQIRRDAQRRLHRYSDLVKLQLCGATTQDPDFDERIWT